MSRNEFEATYRSRKPVLLGGMIDDWPAVSDQLWTPPRLAQRHGAARVLQTSGLVLPLAGTGPQVRVLYATLASATVAIDKTVILLTLSLYHH